MSICSLFLKIFKKKKLYFFFVTVSRKEINVVTKRNFEIYRQISFACREVTQAFSFQPLVGGWGERKRGKGGGGGGEDEGEGEGEGGK